MEIRSSPKAPLRVIVVQHGPLADSEPFVATLRKTFTGDDGSGRCGASDYELLNPVDFRVFARSGGNETPGPIQAEIAADAEGVLVVLLLSTADESARELLGDWASFARSQDQRMFVLAISLATAEATPVPTDLDRGLLSLGLSDLDERDLRRDFLALHALNAALRLLSPVAARQFESDDPSAKQNRPQLFFSHAKRDGVPLATALVSWLERLNRFDFFYDTLDLDLAGNLSEQLERAVANSVLVVLRTEVFDQRYWCQKEIFWSERHGVPVITVDGRWNLHHAPSVVAFDASPSVRIPDGSLARILLSALTEALRVALLRARARLAAEEAGLPAGQWTALARFPSLVSLQAAAERQSQRASPLETAQPFFIVYPNPTMPDGIRDSARDVANALIPGSEVLSLDEFRIRCLSHTP